MWAIWDKKSDINGVSADVVFDNIKFLKNEDTIYIESVNGRVTQIEGKSILASVYGIDPSLPDEEFIAEYERILAEPPVEETVEEN